MKLKYLAVLLFFFSCDGNNIEVIDDMPREAHLKGSWQLTGSKISIGGPLPKDFTPIANGNIFTFEADSSYENREIDGTVIGRGKYGFNDNVLSFASENDSDGVTSFSVTFEFGDMVWSPSGPMLCIEGCLYRYEKLD